MTRKEMIECLEQLRFEEETHFNRRKEKRALRVAIRTMKCDRIKTVIMILLAAILIMSAAWFAIGLIDNARAEDYKPEKGRCYDITLYDGVNRVDITTGIEYINRLSEDTVIVTDRSLDEVIVEIEETQDDVEGLR